MSEHLLQQILNELKEMKVKQQSMNADLQDVKSEQQSMKSQMNSRFDTLDTRVSFLQDDVTKIKSTVERMELNHPEDVIGMLKTINNKLDDRDNEQLAINRRLHRVEGLVEGLTKQ